MRLIDVAEAALELGVSESKVRRMTKGPEPVLRNRGDDRKIWVALDDVVHLEVAGLVDAWDRKRADRKWEAAC